MHCSEQGQHTRCCQEARTSSTCTAVHGQGWAHRSMQGWATAQCLLQRAEKIKLSTACSLGGRPRSEWQQPICAHTHSEAKSESALHTSWWIQSFHKFVRPLCCTDALASPAPKAEELDQRSLLLNNKQDDLHQATSPIPFEG